MFTAKKLAPCKAVVDAANDLENNANMAVLEEIFKNTDKKAKQRQLITQKTMSPDDRGPYGGAYIDPSRSGRDPFTSSYLLHASPDNFFEVFSWHWAN